MAEDKKAGMDHQQALVEAGADGIPDIAPDSVESQPANPGVIETAESGVAEHAIEAKSAMDDEWQDWESKANLSGDEIPPAVEAQLSENQDAASGAYQRFIDGINKIRNDKVARISAEEAELESADVQVDRPNVEDAQDRFIKGINSARDKRVARKKAGEAPENLLVPSDAQSLLEPEPLSPLLAESEPPEDRNLPSAEEAGSTAPETPVENSDIAFTLTRERADNDYNKYTRRQNVFSRYISQKWEKISNWSDRITGLSGENKKDWSDTRYDLLGRASVRIKNFFAGIVFDYRNNGAMKAEGRLSYLRSKINEQEAENEVNRQIRDNPDIPYKERKQAAKDFNAGYARMNKWRSNEATQLTYLKEFETSKEKCWNGIQERSLAVSQAIEERISPMQEKLDDAKSVLAQAEQARNEAAAVRSQFQQKLDNLRIDLLSVPKGQRGLIKQAIYDCNRQLKGYDKAFNKAELGLNACHENIGHLESMINPWQDLSTTYQMMAEKPQYVSKEEKPKYSSTTERVSGYRNEAGTVTSGDNYTGREIIGDNDLVSVNRYLKELADNLGPGQKKFTAEEIESIIGKRNIRNINILEKEVSLLENKVREVLDRRGLNKRQIDGIFNLTRVSHKKVEILEELPSF